MRPFSTTYTKPSRCVSKTYLVAAFASSTPLSIVFTTDSVTTSAVSVTVSRTSLLTSFISEPIMETPSREI